MSFFHRLFGRKGRCCNEQPPSMPWDQQPSILEFLRSHISVDQCGLTRGGELLPDEERINKLSHIHWAPGARDGEEIQHTRNWVDQGKVNKTFNLILAYTLQPTVFNKSAIYEHIVAERVVSIMDSVIVAITNENRIKHERLYELAYSFITESPDREPVKFGVAILGAFSPRGNEDLFQTLGRHEEFTLFCAFALANMDDDNEVPLWELARNVGGWGRIEAVKRLSKTENREIQDWLLREGFRNSVRYEYLAATCARSGDLLTALSQESTDRELLTSAGEIIQALIAAGPSGGIDDYEDGRMVIETYINRMSESAETVEDFLHVNSIMMFLHRSDLEWQSRMASGWTHHIRDSLTTACYWILSDPEWSKRVQSSLNSLDDVTFYRADQVAKVLGIDTWRLHWRRLHEKPFDSERWFHVMSLCNDERILDVTKFAEKHLFLGEFVSEAGKKKGFGPTHEFQFPLDQVLHGLRSFAGHGRSLIAAGLKCKSVGSRKLAVAALAASSRNKWPKGLYDSLKLASQIESDRVLRRQMRQALCGEPLTQ